ncbi:hypothetical protein ACA910_016979 [Epithemia clementina (nom. ined.)]
MQNSSNLGDDMMMGSGSDPMDDGGNDDGLDMQDELDRNGQHHPIAEFLYQLTKMLTDDNSEIIEWADGRIKVHYPERLEAEVLHKYFRHSKFASFQRQLNYFGFRKIAGKGKMSPCSYVNDAATSDIRSLLLIKRKTNGSAARKAAMQQRAAVLASSSLNPLLQFPGAAALLSNNPAALASLANPHALSGAMALLSDNALRAGLFAQQANAMASNPGASPQLSFLLQQQQQLQQQQLQQQQQQQQASSQQQQVSAAAQSLFSNWKKEESAAAAAAALGGFSAPPQPSPAPTSTGSHPLLHVDHSQIAQQTQQLQQLQQQLKQLQQQQRNQQQKAQSNVIADQQPSSLLGGSATAALNGATSGSLSQSQSQNDNSSSDGATKLSATSQFEQFLAARLAAVNQNSSSCGLANFGAASAALKFQLPSSSNDNPASAALQQQFSSMPATAAMDADSAAAQTSNNLFESALNLKSLLQEHQAASSQVAINENNGGQGATRGSLMNRLPSSGTIFPSVASFGNLLNSSNRLSSLLSLSSFGGGNGGPGGSSGAPGPGASRAPSLADLAAVIQPNSSTPFNAATLAALQQHANSASAAANQFRSDNNN